jgi:hypothetical protein
MNQPGVICSRLSATSNPFQMDTWLRQLTVLVPVGVVTSTVSPMYEYPKVRLIWLLTPCTLRFTTRPTAASMVLSSESR